MTLSEKIGCPPIKEQLFCLYKLAVSEDYQGASGKHFDDNRGTFAEAHPDAYDETEIEKLLLQQSKLLLIDNEVII